MISLIFCCESSTLRNTTSTRGVRISSAVVSSKSSAERTISLSLSSRTPSSSMLSTMYFSSFSVTVGASSLLPEILSARERSFMNTNTSGVSRMVIALSSPAVALVNASQCSLARHLGMTSPKVSISSVVAPVAIAEPISPNIRRQSTVAIDEQPRLTMLLQIRIAVRALSKCSMTQSTFSAFLSPFSTACCTRILLTKENAVSVAEKNADSNTSRAMTTPIIISEFN